MASFWLEKPRSPTSCDPNLCLVSVIRVAAMAHLARCSDLASSPEFVTPPRGSKRSAVEMAIGDTANQENVKAGSESWISPLDATYEKPFKGLKSDDPITPVNRGAPLKKKRVYAIFNNLEITFKCHDPALEDQFDDILVSSYGEWMVNRDRNKHHKVPYSKFSKWLEEDLEGKGWELVKQRVNSQYWGKSPKK